MDSFGYKLFFLLHILSVIVAFAPGFVWPVVSVNLKKQQKPVGPAIGALAAGNSTKVHGPALVLSGFFGFGLIGMSDKVWEFSQSWISVAMLLWFIMIGVLFGMMIPAEKRSAAGDESADKIVAMSSGILHLLLLLMLVDMIWKPGL